MKMKLFAVLSFAVIFNHLQAADLPQTFTTANCPCVLSTSPAEAFLPAKAWQAGAKAYKVTDPIDINVVVSQKRIWLVADERPMKCLKAQIKNAEGKIVLEKCFTSKCADWFLNIEALPKGDYTLHLGADYVEKFKK